MERLQAFKFELRPNGGQQRNLCRFAGSCRYVYNKALAIQIKNHEDGNKYISYADMCKNLTEWRNDPATPWLKDSPVHPLQQALQDLDRAFKNFFAGRAKFPRYKKKGSGGGFRYPDQKQFKLDQGNSRIFLPKLGWIRYRKSRDVLGTLCSFTVSQSGGKWFVSILTKREVEQPVHQATSIIGIDVGITRFATLSDGTHIEPINTFKKHEKKLAKYQRRMANKVKFSKNWKKAKAKVQKVQTNISNARRDFLQKTSTTISKNHAVVCVEALQVRNMSKSASGTTETPGRMVAAKSGLNKAILDQGWGMFFLMLQYKMLWLGGYFVAVPPQNTSRTCPACGHVSGDNRKTQAKFLCVSCGYENNADLVGAINVRERGHRSLACGEPVQSGRSVKQEPPEVSQAAA